MATVDGLDGDEQADRRLHGGTDKAIYGYGHDAYDHWIQAMPRHASRLVPGAMGENLTISHLDETNVHIGDIVRIGGSVLQVTEPRQPCFKLVLFFDDAAVPRAMIRSGMCGWYYRVLEPGLIGAGDELALLSRPNPDWPVRRLFEIIVARAIGRELLAEMLAIEGLSEGLKLRALRGLARLHDGA